MIERKYLALDLEISTPIPDGESDWSKYRPFGISCVVTKGSDHEYPLMWFSRDLNRLGEKMNLFDLHCLLEYLCRMVKEGYTIVTFNGAGFDFGVLHEEFPHFDWVRLAFHHVDLFFHIFATKGYCKGLDCIAKGMGLSGKPDGMDGAKAPQMWLCGEYHKVLDYCAKDVETTLQLAHLCEQQRCVRWVASNNVKDGIDLPNGWLTVAEAERLPEPDTSWMGDRAWKRSKFTGWLK